MKDKDKQRRQFLARKARARATANAQARAMAQADNIQTSRARIDAAVNRAVCEYTGSDGVNYCLQYASVGCFLASSVLGKHYLPQAGTLRVRFDPSPNPLCLEMRADKGGMERGEFHCWFVLPGKNDIAAEVVDLTSRHYVNTPTASGH